MAACRTRALTGHVLTCAVTPFRRVQTTRWGSNEVGIPLRLRAISKAELESVQHAPVTTETVAQQVASRLQMLDKDVERFHQQLSTAKVSDWDRALSILNKNADCLSNIFLRKAVLKLFKSQPVLLATEDMSLWTPFLQSYGLDDEQLYALLLHSSSVMLGNTPYRMGQNILFLKQRAGLSDEDIVSRVFSCYPSLLASDEASMQSSVDALEALGLFPGEVEAVLRQYPSLLMREVHSELLPILERIMASRQGKYAVTGAYHL